MADSTLAAIITKVRRLTRSPSESLLSDAEITEYVNTFMIYDMPEHLRLFSLRTTLAFYTQPYIDMYETNTVDLGHPLYNFKNRYTSVHAPVYIAGRRSFFTQSREQFYAVYPALKSVAATGHVGNGITTTFAGTLSQKPVLRNHVLFSAVDVNNAGLALYDEGGIGILGGNGFGSIDYVTGVYNLTFDTAPKDKSLIYSQTVPYVPAIPTALLFFDNKFYVRPVPNQPYRVEVEVYRIPFTNEGFADEFDKDLPAYTPEIQQWWQYIAYGAAKKVLEDRTDTDSISRIMPEYKQQELLVLRKTIVQQSNERTATIYTEQTNFPYGGRYDWNF